MSGESNFTASDLAITETIETQDAIGGGGLLIDNSTIALERFLVSGTPQVALFARAATLVANHVLIQDTRSGRWDETLCPEDRYGVGIGAYGNSDLTIEDFNIEGSQLCGAQIAEGGRLSWTNGRVASNAIGICFQEASADLSALTQSVVFEDNETNIETTDLPLPQFDPTTEPR